jgi:putative membrane protein
MKRVISLALAFIITLGAATTAFATGTGSQKEEVVYIITDAGGTVQSVNIVNIFGSGDVTDYGDYEAVKMLTTNDAITQNGDTVTFSTTVSKVYYQGTVKSTDIPWNIGIHYYLDGVEYSAVDMAGKNGKLEIRFKVSKNSGYNGTFFEDYALQASFTLNTERADNIIAADATAANVGKNKQLTFTVLPGTGIDTSITADVTDFEMDAVSINGIKLNLNIDVDYSELTEKTDELTDGIVKLDDGANELKDGVVEFKDGISSLNSGISELKEGTIEAGDGINKLNDKSGELKEGSSDIKSAIENEFTDGAIDLKDGVVKLNDGITELKEGIEKAGDGINKLRSNSGELKSGSADVKSVLQNEFMNGTVELKNGISNLNRGIAGLKDGIKTAQNGINALSDKSGELVRGSAEVKAALNTISVSLSGVSSSAERLEQLLDASGAIAAGIENLYEGAETLKYSLGYSQYKALMGQNGLDIDTLKVGNLQAISGLTKQINYLQATLSQISDIPDMESQAAELLAQIGLLQDVVQLLTANNAAIGGTEGYLDGLSAGADRLYSGLGELKSNYDAFDAGIAELANTLSGTMANMSILAAGINELATKYEQLDGGIVEYTGGISQLVVGFSKITDGVNELATGGNKLATGAQSLYDGTIDLAANYEKLDSGIIEYTDGVSELANEYPKITDGVRKLADGGKDLTEAADKIYDGVEELKENYVKLNDGITEYTDGVSELADGYGKITDGFDELADGGKELTTAVGELYDGATELTDGTGELRDKTADMDSQINEKINEMLDSARGNGGETVSFVSDKNTNVKSVQFVIKTTAIEKSDTATAAPEPKETLNFWQKLLRLFGWY